MAIEKIKKNIKRKQIFILLLIIFLVGIFFISDLDSYINLSFIKAKQAEIEAIYNTDRYLSVVVFFLLYVLMTALSLPGATIMTLISGAIFGLFLGTVLVSFASSIGATLAFLASRYLFRDMFKARFARQFEMLNAGFSKEGGYYLFSLRLTPIFPFFLINIVMGLTSIPVWGFYLISQLGMFPATLLFVNAGTQISQIQSTGEILSWPVIFSLILLGLVPIVIKKVTDYLKTT